ncbi:MAG: phosphoglycerate dehydrogenase [Anaerolineaceae bacterium]|nr:phosphoglycerate dehydrogenase [Anaerolineaceae bacterium]
MPTVLLTAPYMLPTVNRFIPVFDHYGIELIQPDVEERMEEADILAYAGQFDATICGDDRYSRNVLEACLPRLKVISKWGTGIDSIDKKSANKLGIQVCNTPNAFTLPVADSVLAYMLAFARQQIWMDKAIKQGIWQKIPGISLSECTVGVIGVGNIGKAILRRASAFGMRLLGNDIIPMPPEFLAEYRVEMMTLEEMLPLCDFVSVNCVLDKGSEYIVNQKTLAMMKPNAVVINTARGPLINEADLIDALQQKVIGGAALDVFEVEPLPDDSPLKSMENVLLAPHNSNSSPAAWERVHWNTIRNLLHALEIPCTDFEEMIK